MKLTSKFSPEKMQELLGKRFRYGYGRDKTPAKVREVVEDIDIFGNKVGYTIYTGHGTWGIRYPRDFFSRGDASPRAVGDFPQKFLDEINDAAVLYPTMENEGTPPDETKIYAQFYLENFTWLVAGCEVRGDDVLFYGYVINHNIREFSEWGFFTLKELMAVKLPGSSGVMRDVEFKECKFGDYMNA